MTTVTYYELSNYNNGTLISRTFDLEGKSEEEHDAERSEWLDLLSDEHGREYEEWIIADTEGVPDEYVGEWDIDPEFFELEFQAAFSHLDRAVFMAGAALGIEPKDIEEMYQGEYSSDEEFAEELADQLGLIDPEASWPQNCIDWEHAARELMYDYGEQDGHYFRTAY